MLPGKSRCNRTGSFSVNKKKTLELDRTVANGSNNNHDKEKSLKIHIFFFFFNLIEFKTGQRCTTRANRSLFHSPMKHPALKAPRLHAH